MACAIFMVDLSLCIHYFWVMSVINGNVWIYPCVNEFILLFYIRYGNKLTYFKYFVVDKTEIFSGFHV